MKKLWLATVLLTAFPHLASARPPPVYDPIDPTDYKDRARIVKILLKKVAYISVNARPRKNDAYPEVVQDGYGVALGPRRIVCLSFLVERAESVSIKGPNGKTTTAKVILYDIERRVAILEPKDEVSKIGLEIVELSSVKDREIDQPVFAITATEEPYVVDGVITDLGLAPELEGALVTDLKLSRGMPAFDDRARLVGYGRTVDWDANRFLLVSPETIEIARTATKTEGRSEIAPKKKSAEEPSSEWLRGTKGAR